MFKKISVLFFSLLMVLFSFQPAKAAVLTWEPMVNSTFSPSDAHRSPGFDDENNLFAISMVSFDSYVYVSNWSIMGTEIWRSNNGTSWEPANENGFGDPAALSYAILAVFNGHLYAFNWGFTEEHVDVYEYISGTQWTDPIIIGDEETVIIAPTAVATYNNILYVALVNGTATGTSAVYGSTDGTTWTPSNIDGFGVPENVVIQSMATYNNQLYAGTTNTETGSQIWRTSNGITWTQNNTSGFDGGLDIDNVGTNSLTSFGGALYASTDNSATGTEVWKSLGGADDWEIASNIGFNQGAGTNCSYPCGGSAVFKNKLYIGDSGAGGTKVFSSSDGISWEQVNVDGFGYPDNLFVVFTVLGDYLYAGTGTLSFGTTEVYRYYEATPVVVEALPQTGADNLNGYILDAIL